MHAWGSKRDGSDGSDGPAKYGLKARLNTDFLKTNLSLYLRALARQRQTARENQAHRQPDTQTARQRLTTRPNQAHRQPDTQTARERQTTKHTDSQTEPDSQTDNQADR